MRRVALAPEARDQIAIDFSDDLAERSAEVESVGAISTRSVVVVAEDVSENEGVVSVWIDCSGVDDGAEDVIRVSVTTSAGHVLIRNVVIAVTTDA